MENLSPFDTQKCGHSLAHTQHPVDLLDTEPVEDIRHQRLESHVLHPRNILCPFEIFRGAVRSAFPRIIHKILHENKCQISSE